MNLRRRDFMRRMAGAGGGVVLSPSLAGLWAITGCDPQDRSSGPEGQGSGYGALRPSADCPELEIPDGFRCVRLSSGGQPSSVNPDLVVPNAFDGMASFPMPDGTIRLIRNHEMVDAAGGTAFGWPAYDPGATGGTTTLEVRITGEGEDLQVELLREWVSLAGTRVNCAGGPTPWGSWLSCEENTWGQENGFAQEHGYIFEVPASAEAPVDAIPLREMGRFVHEAVAVDPDTGIVYETEDAWYVPDSDTQIGAGFYRFLPDEPGRLEAGGQLQMLAIEGQPAYLTARGQTPGQVFPATWVDIDDPDPPNAESDPLAVFRQGLAKGGAIFARLEGAFYHEGGIYIVSTNGGDETAGQVFEYRPTGTDTGELRLIFESPSRDVLEGPDNICVRPGGGLIMCEDASGEQYVRGLDAEGTIVDLVRQPSTEEQPTPGEFAGSCFSPDGRVMFVNVQGGRTVGRGRPSVTYALWGPWENGTI